MKFPFVKLHGAKNDFLLTENADLPPEIAESEFGPVAVAICNRYTGVGADGWMLIDRAAAQEYDAAIRLFNSDGSEPELSGNGTRCAAALIARDRPGKCDFRIKTGAGIKHLSLIESAGSEYRFEMDMGTIRVAELNAQIHGMDAVLLDVGNPQCAVFVNGFGFSWREIGAAIEQDPRFPNRTNVSFVVPVDRHTIDVHFWERGAGETNSSGTGSTGAAFAAIARGICDSPLKILTPAGPLFFRRDGGVYLTGPAQFVAEGTYIYEKMALLNE